MIGRITYSMNVSLDGFINDAQGSLDWALVDDEIHGFWNDHIGRAGAFVYGRRLYETMAAYWPTAESDPEGTPTTFEFARVWNSKPIIVFSNSLTAVSGNARLVRGDVSAVLRAIRDETVGELQIGGAHLAQQFIRAGIVDEYRPVIHPAILGSGTPYLPPGMAMTPLRLIDTRRFANGAVALSYESGVP
jgi:dihydrofolate reductase